MEAKGFVAGHAVKQEEWLRGWNFIPFLGFVSVGVSAGDGESMRLRSLPIG
jgi:hypothetical protein